MRDFVPGAGAPASFALAVVAEMASAMLAASDTDERAGLFGVMVAISPGRHGCARLSYKRCDVSAGRPEPGLLSACGCARQTSGRIRRTREPAAEAENSIEAPISLARRRMLPRPRPGTLLGA